LTTDAKNRALRTFLQGLAVDVAISIAVVIITVFATADDWGDLQWTIIGFSLFKTVLTTIASFVMRRFVDRPGSVALPPDPPGPPSEPNPPQDFLPPTQDA
jgi:hypothetical protein